MGPAPLLSLRAITKRFPGVTANDRVDLDVHRGEVLALVGENGAGKSTLMKILYGFYRADAGEIRLEGRPVEIRSPHDARRFGIGLVFQDFVQIPALTVAENIALFLPDLPWVLDTGAVAGRIRAMSARYGFDIDPAAEVWRLSVGERQKVEVLKLVLADARILVLDEPTRSLAPHEVDGLFARFAQLRRDGYAVVFIAHKLREVLACADRITVMRRGADEGALPAHQGRLPQLPAVGGQQGLRVRGVAGQGRGDRGHAGDPQALRRRSATEVRAHHALGRRVKQELSEHHGCRLPAAIHGLRASAAVASVRSGPQPHDRRKPVAHEQRVGPDARSPTAAVAERMDAHPLRMGPGAQINDSSQAIGIQVGTCGVALIQRSDDALQPLLEGGELAGHLGWRHSLPGVNPNPCVLESRLAAEATDVLGVRHHQPCHGVRLPIARGFHRGEIPANRAVADVTKDLGEVASQLCAVFVPISHEGVRGPSFGQGPLRAVAYPPSGRRGRDWLRPR